MAVVPLDRDADTSPNIEDLDQLADTIADKQLVQWRSNGQRYTGIDPEDVAVTAAWGGPAVAMENWLELFFRPTGTAATDTTNLATFLQYCATNNRVAVLDKDFSLNASTITITGDLTVRCSAKITNAQGTGATTTLLNLTGSGTLNWTGGSFDGADTAYSVFIVTEWAVANVYIDEVYNLLGTVSSPGSQSGLWFNGVASGVAGWGHAYDMDQGGATAQGSVPRVFSTSSLVGESNVTVYPGRSTNIHGHIVVGDNGGGRVLVRGGEIVGAADNGIYNVGDATEVIVDGMNATDIDEMFVNTGDNKLSVYNCTGREMNNSCNTGSTNGGILFDNCDFRYNPGVNPFGTRASNVATPSFEVRNSRIECTPAIRIVDFSTYGTCDKFVDENNTWIIHYDSSVYVSGVVFSMTPGSTCQVMSSSTSEWIWDVVAGSSAPTSVTLFWTMPTVTALSYWNSRFVNLTGENTSTMRLSAARQQLLSFSGYYSLPTISSESAINSGALTSAPPREVWGSTTAPTNGYWQAGSRIRFRAPAANGPTEMICTTAGTPGTWINSAPTYETGSFTPAVTFATVGDFSPTYTTQTGYYERIGQTVRGHILLQFTSNAYTTASGAFTISGLPFTVASANGGCSPTRIQNATYGASQVQFGFYPAVTTSTILGYAFRSALSPSTFGTTNIPASTSNFIIELEFSYRTS
jgi:hypothetical protein